MCVHGDTTFSFHLPASAVQRSTDSAGGSVTAPMPGRVTKVMAQPGAVSKGTTLLVMEAMKMEVRTTHVHAYIRG